MMISETTATTAPALHHVCVVVSDLDVAREFYVDVMGAVEDIRPSDFVFKGAYFTIGSAEVHVVQEGRPGHLAQHAPCWSTEELSTGLVSHLALMVDDIGVYIDRLRERGIERVGGYRVRDDYVEQAYIADPDGNIIELMQRHDEHDGRLRRQQIFDDGTAVPVAPGFPLVDPRERYGEFTDDEQHPGPENGDVGPARRDVRPAGHEAGPAARDVGPAGRGGGRPRVVIAVDLPEQLCRRIEEAEPRVQVVRDHSLTHPRRFPADWEGDPAHERTAEQQQAYEAMVDSADGLFSLPDVSPAALARTVQANPRLRWVMTMAAGGGAQLRAAGLAPEDLARVTVTTSAGVHGGPLAEFALLGVFAGAKDLPRLQRDQRAHEWAPRREMKHLDAMDVLVVGLGGIGRACAERLHALGARVMGTTRSGTLVRGVDELVPIGDLAAAAARADAIVVTLPGTDGTHHLIGADVLGGLRPGATLVNVGRGTVIDEAALVDALDAGRVGLAALDVFETEPLPSDSPLWDHPNVLVSPHTAALDAREETRIVDQFIENLERYLDGRALRNVVDTVEFY